MQTSPEVRRPAAASAAASALRHRLIKLRENERLKTLMVLVQEDIAAVLALPAASSVPADQRLKEFGLDSLMSVELSNRLSGRVGTKLPTTLAFDYPTPEAIAALLLRQIFPELNAVATTAATRPQVRDEPIAIVAMACRTPGGVEDSEAYWALLAEGRDAIGPFPARWSSYSLYDPDPETRGKSYAREGGFLHDVDQFDAGFFGIAPREAVSMDPQQRLVLEVVWEALERAGLQPEALNQSSTGVYLGSMRGDYRQNGIALETLDGYVETGQASSMLSGRISYVLGLEGPAMTIDTACSSSLAALHLACAALRHGECDLALTGGVQVMSTPSVVVEFSRLRGMAPDGRSKSFSDDADGAGWSEGCGVLVLKRQSDAERDGDEILALIRGSAVNQDGRSQGLTAPNGPSQQRVIRAALSASGVRPEEIDVVEAHGTGTSLGDPIEAGALAAVFGPTRGADRPLWLGSSKSNLGHTQAAAGVLGVMKMVLALRHEVLPKTLHAERPSGRIEWESSGLSLLQQARAWPWSAARVRRAGVSSFGISGTNAHVVLEEAPARASMPLQPSSLQASLSQPPMSQQPMIPLLVSGRDAAALRAQAGRYAEWLSGHPEAEWSGVVRTAALHRTQFAVRAAVSAGDASEAIEALRALAGGRAHAALSVGEARSGHNGKLAFLLTGQGAQQPGMGRALLEACAGFRAAFEEICGHFDALLELPLRDVMFAEAGSEAAARLDQTAYAQPALFAMEVALARQLAQWGVEPDILLGHSIGELAAAHLSGVWSVKDACRVVAARGRLMQALPAGGAMMALEAGEAEVRALLDELRDTLGEGSAEIAALNGPRATVISGDEAAVLAVAERLRSRGRRTSRLQVSHAFHSRRMEPMLAAFRTVLSSVDYAPPRLPVVSNVTGRLATQDELCSADYWVRQVRSPVRFVDGVGVLDAAGVQASLELGPDGILTALAAACLPEASPQQASPMQSPIQAVAAQRRGRDGTQALMAALGELHVHGVAVDWEKVAGAGGSRQLAGLPTYAFQRQRYWLEAAKPGGDVATLGQSSAEHPLLGAATALAQSDGFLLTGRLSLAEAGWLGDHAVFGTVLVPGTGLLELGFAAARAVGLTTVSQLTLVSPLVMPAEGAVRLQVQVDGPDAGSESGESGQGGHGGGRGLGIYSRLDAAPEGTPWTLHAQGMLGAGAQESGQENGQDNDQDSGLAAWPPAGGERIDLSGHYAGLAARGYGYGPLFQGLREAYRVGDVVYGRAVLAEALWPAADGYGLHPALLDGALHVLGLAQIDGGGDGGNPDGGDPDGVAGDASLLLPFAWSEVSLVATGARELRVRAQIARGGDGEALARLQLADGHGRVVARVGGLRLREASEAQLRQASGELPSRSEAQHLYRLEWRAVALGEAGAEAIVPLMVGGDGALAARLGFDHVESVAAVLARLDAGASASSQIPPLQIVFDHLSEPGANLVGANLVGASLVGASLVGASLVEAAHATAIRGLAELQGILGDARLNETSMTWLTRGAVATGPDEGTPGLSQAPLWGLVRTARAEHSDRRLQLVDVDAAGVDALGVNATGADAFGADTGLLGRLLSMQAEPELALRHGAVMAPRLAPRLASSLARAGAATDALELPAAAPDYRMAVTGAGRLDGVSLVAAPELSAPLPPGHIRVGVRAAGMNFRDVLITLGQIESPGIGFEFAGVVEAVGADVTSVGVGDRVFGLGLGCFATRAVMAAQLVTQIPAGMSFAAAATVPLAFLTALYALQELGQVRAGDRVLVHAAAGGVGMAAVQLCRHFGAEVYGTASAGKWPVLERMGLDARHIASSRDLGFETQFLAATDGRGMDVVLNALAGEFVDASLRLLPQGGRFLEMGIADVRGPDSIAATYPGVSYQAFVLGDKGPEQIQALLKQLMGLFAAGVLEALPYVAYDVRQMPAALRQMAQGRHIGKQVVQLPRRLAPDGTVLITGGAGKLGREVARHLVGVHGVRHLVLTSRRGPATPGAAELVAELQALGAQTIGVVGCDVSDRDAVRAVVDGIAPAHPLTGVFHLAATLDDGIVPALTPQRLARVLRPKLDGAWHLHALTVELDLAAFVLFSSVAGLGNAGQANYAAANVFLDGLAAERRHRGLAGQSLMWGLWEQRGVGMTAHLGRADLMRMRRQGVQALSLQLGLALLDAAQAQPDAVVIPIHLDIAVMQRGFGEDVPALYRGLMRGGGGLRRASAAGDDTGTLRARLAALANEAERLAALVALAQEEIAAVLALPGAASVPADQPLNELGLDSLMAVALRNRLSSQVGTRLPTTLAFDYPTARAMAKLMLDKMELGNVKSASLVWGDEQIRRKLRFISIQALRESGLLDRIMIQPNDTSPRRASDDELSAHIDGAETASLLDIASELL